jgi:hypothetical protein
LNHISDKAVRFMRAHLAQIIIDNSPMTTEICMQLVEHSLDFDDSIAVLYRPPLSVSAVLYDARDVHTQWVTADGNFFLSYMSHCCIDYKEVCTCVYVYMYA